MKRYSTFPWAPVLNITFRLLCHIKDTSWVGWGSSLQRCSWCILQLQPRKVEMASYCLKHMNSLLFTLTEKPLHLQEIWFLRENYITEGKLFELVSWSHNCFQIHYLPYTKLLAKRKEKEKHWLRYWKYTNGSYDANRFNCDNGRRDRISIPDRVIPKLKKMVLDTSLLNTQYFKARIKDKWSSPGKGVAPFLTPWCGS